MTDAQATVSQLWVYPVKSCAGVMVQEATLTLPSTDGFVTTGKHGAHSEHLSFLLNEMQSLARTHPEGVW